MTEKKIYRRLVRRSLHRSRSVAVSVALAITAFAAAFVGTESVLAALKNPPLLLSPEAALAAVDKPGQWELAGAAALAVIALVLLALALAPGRQGRHEVANERMAVVVDDAALAGAIGASTAAAARLPVTRVAGLVSRARADIRVTPTTGAPLDADMLTASASALIDSLDLHPRLRPRVAIAANGVIGS